MGSTPFISNENPLSCSYFSSQAGEPLLATATHTRAWLLLEYPPPWLSKAFNESHLPEPVKAYFDAVLKTLPSSRLQFIYRQPGRQTTGRSFFIGSGEETQPFLYEIRFQSYEELLDLDIQALLIGSQTTHSLIQHDFLLLVCTNGRRDPCCSLNGLPVFKALAKEAQESVWQTIHVGGHRFAANAVWLPHGLYFGRLTPEDTAPFLSACRTGQIYLPNFRGRASYPAPAQAADTFLRSRTGRVGIGDYRLAACDQIAPDRWQVILRDQTSGQEHRLVIKEDQSLLSTLQSCRDAGASPVTIYSLESYQDLAVEENTYEPEEHA